MAEEVNVHQRAIRAADRVGSNGNMQGTVEAKPSREPWWKDYFKWEPMTVAGKVIEKGWVVPQTLGIALLLVIITGVGGLYWKIIDRQAEQEKSFNAKMQEQRDLLIRLDQRLLDKNDHDNQRFDRIERKQQDSDANAEAWRGVTDKRLAKVER